MPPPPQAPPVVTPLQASSRKERRKYLTTHSTHFILRLYDVRHMVKDHPDNEKGRKVGNVLFNDALNTFYLRLYGVIYMV